jgi:hypothetical protein
MTVTLAWRLASSGMRRAHPCELIAATAVIASGTIILNCLILGTFGEFALRWILLLSGVEWLLISRVVPARDSMWHRTAARLTRGPMRRLGRWALTACLLGVLAAGALGVFAPQANYDAIGYHLTAAATWVQEARVRLVPTPFGDNAQAYMPANFELIEAWLMLPFHADLFARAAQFPFLGLLMLGAYVLARNLSIKRRWAVVAPFLLLFSRHLLGQSGSAMVDVALAAFIMVALALAAGAGRTGCRFTFFISGLAMGVAIGTKSSALAMLPVVFALVLVLSWRGLRRQTASSVAVWVVGLALCGSFWYLRNASLTGNPVYPLRVSIGETTILPGAFGREIMTGWLFNRSNRPDCSAAVSEVFTPLLGKPSFGPPWLGYIAWILLWSSAVWMTARDRIRHRKERIATVASVPILLAIQWWYIPYQEPRFFFVTIALVCVGAAMLAARNRQWAALVAAVLTAHVFLCLGWYVFLWALLGVGSAAFMLRAPLRKSLSTSVGRGLVAVSVFWVLAVWGAPELTRARAFARHDRFREAWHWADGNLSSVRIGYTGHNIPYYLFGAQLENRVFPINVDEHAEFAFHDYAVLDNEMTRSQPISPEAALYRATLDQRAWIENIHKLELDYLVISTVGENQMLTIRHDSDGFPVEARWAKKAPETFSLEYEDRNVRIYRIARGSPPAEFEQPIVRSESDCFTLRSSDAQRYRELYPWADERIRKSPQLRALLERYGQALPTDPDSANAQP